MQVSRALLDRGARPEIHVLATHGVFSDPAIERLQYEPISEVVITNSIALPPQKKINKFVVLSIAPLLGDAIRRIHHGVSVSVLFD
ncbi:MAG TPA: ribose-phosphate pyrophosphokinase, partial [Firmicutes bacterium]|nr:ribose-phosphate pyrophosphokinase [Bacillota bacterium]